MKNATELMEDFPRVTESLLEKARQKLRPHLIFDNKSGKCYCTHCEKEIEPLFEPKHKEKMKYCSRCRKEAIAINNKYAYNGHVVESTANVVVFMKRRNSENLYASGIVLNLFFYHGSLKPHIDCYETQRYIFTEKQSYRYGVNPDDGEWHKRFVFTEPIFKPCSPYQGYDSINTRVISQTCMRYSCIDMMFPRFPISWLGFYNSHKGVERLIKAGMGDLIMGGNYGATKYYVKDCINLSESELPKMLGVTSDVVRAIRQEKINYFDYLDVQRYFPNETLDTLIRFSDIIAKRYGTLDTLAEITEMSHKEILKYLIKQEANLGDYYDYISTARELNYNLTDEIVSRPPHFEEAHDRMEEARRAAKIEKERDKLLSVEAEFTELKEKRKAYEYSYGGYHVRQPNTLTEIIAEGQELSHCVGGYAMIHGTGKLNIMFLRKDSAPDKPYYTIEVSNDGRIVQCRGYANNWVARGGEEKPQAIEDFEKLYQKHLDKVFETEKTKKKSNKKKKARKIA